MPPAKDKLKERLANYCLFLKWLEANNKRMLHIAYQLFVKETGITV